MPKIFRVMKGEDGKPRIGPSSSALGVRLPGGAGKPDITPDADGKVSPGEEGMSVAPDVAALVRRLLPDQLPKRLRARANDASLPSELRILLGRAAGTNALVIWSMGEGPFVECSINEDLALRPDPEPAEHGVVIPAFTMPVNHYQNALAATRDLWREDESAV